MSFENILHNRKIADRFDYYIDCFMNKQDLSERNIGLEPSFLIHGPMGIGKSFMLEEFIDAVEFPVYDISGDIDRETFRLLDEVEERRGFHIIAIDDLDLMLEYAGRDDIRYFMCRLHRLTQSGNVFVIATAEEEKPVIEIARRYGLFMDRFELKRPTVKEASNIIDNLSLKKNLKLEVLLDDLGKVYESHTFKAMEIYIDRMASRAFRDAGDADGSLTISRENVSRELNDYYFLPDHDRDLFTTQNVRSAAVHEAGHILVAEYFQPECIAFAIIRKHGDADDCEGKTVRWCEVLQPAIAEIPTCLGGAAAVETITGEAASGCGGDFEKAALYARCDVSVSGLAGFDYLEIAPTYDENPEADKVAINQKARERIKKDYSHAKRIIEKNRALLDALSEHLFEHGIIYASEIRRIIGEYGMEYPDGDSPVLIYDSI